MVATIEDGKLKVQEMMPGLMGDLHEGPGILPSLLGMLPERFQWTLHNLVAHPLGEVLYQIGLSGVANTIHDATMPHHEPGTGRG